MEIAPRRLIGMVIATSVLAAGAAWLLRPAPVAGLGPVQPPRGDSFLRPDGGVLGRFTPRDCEPVAYEGPATRLYSDRPYHTRESVASLAGHHFCRAARHGRALWILHVARESTLYTIASPRYGLERAGWQALDEPVRVAAAGHSFDRLYRLQVVPGRYAIHYGHATTANPVFWNPRDVRVVPIPPADG